jgi:hypothetical protein
LPFTQNLTGTGASVSTNVYQNIGANLLKNAPVGLNTGTTSTGFAGIVTNQTSGYAITASGAKFCMRYEMVTPSILSNATDTYSLQIGVSIISPNTNTNNIGFYYSHGTNSGAWTCMWGTLAASSASSSVSVAVSTKYILEIEFIMSTSIKYYINGVLVLTQTTGLPTQWSIGTNIGASYIFKIAGTTNIQTYQGSILYRRLI